MYENCDTFHSMEAYEESESSLEKDHLIRNWMQISDQSVTYS